MENLTLVAFEALVLTTLPSFMVRGALVFPSVARIRMEGWVVVTLSIRGFWDIVTDPRDF